MKNYLLYASGEIILVVVGILIALQINAVYQKYLDHNAAIKVLSRMIVDLDADFKRLTFIDTTYSSSLEEIKELYAILTRDKIDNIDTLEKISWFHGADIKDVICARTTFDEMVNSGNIYKLKNDSLIKEIIEYYRLAEENVFQSREDRREFRRFIYSSEMLDYFYIRSASKKQRLGIAQEFFKDPLSRNYRRLLQSVNWSGGLTRRGKMRNIELMNVNRALKESIIMELDKQ